MFMKISLLEGASTALPPRASELYLMPETRSRQKVHTAIMANLTRKNTPLLDQGLVSRSSLTIE